VSFDVTRTQSLYDGYTTELYADIHRYRRLCNQQSSIMPYGSIVFYMYILRFEDPRILCVSEVRVWWVFVTAV